jgi:hypothetical protein
MVLLSTTSGLEYFVDVLVEVSMQERAGEIVRVFQVVKSNSPAFEVGFEMTGDVSFKDFLDHMKREHGTELPMEKPAPSSIPEVLEDRSARLTVVQPQMTVQELITKAERLGFKQSDLVTGAKVYHNQPNIHHLTPEQIADLDRRMTARAEKVRAAEGDAPATEAKQAASANQTAARTQPVRNIKRA